MELAILTISKDNLIYRKSNSPIAVKSGKHSHWFRVFKQTNEQYTSGWCSSLCLIYRTTAYYKQAVWIKQGFTASSWRSISSIPSTSVVYLLTTAAHIGIIAVGLLTPVAAHKKNKSSRKRQRKRQLRSCLTYLSDMKVAELNYPSVSTHVLRRLGGLVIVLEAKDQVLLRWISARELIRTTFIY